MNLGRKNLRTMKGIILIVMIIVSNSIFAQNYQNICSPGVSFYSDDAFYNLLAFSRDSMVVYPNLDTLFISYPAIHDSGGNCYDTTNGSVFGRKVLRTALGSRFLFFNWVGDTITIIPGTGLNQGWTLFHFTNGPYFQANVSSIAPESFLGTTDMVKTITLQAKNGLGVNIPHPINGMTFKISEHYGIISFFKIYKFPEEVWKVSLAGKQTPLIGVQYASAFDLFNFEIGDEFHYKGFYKNYQWYGGLTEWKEIKTIVSKSIYIDSIVYKSYRCRRETRTESPYYLTIQDTVMDVYYLADPFYSSLPEQFLPATNQWYATPYCNAFEGFCGRLIKVLRPNAYSYSLNCWGMGSGGVSGDEIVQHYTDGLGETFYHRRMTMQMLIERREELMFFHKGNEICGTPVAVDCSVLVGQREVSQSDKVEIKIVPNPARSFITINFRYTNDKSYEILVLNILGEEVLTISVPENEQSANIDVNDWTRGLYIVLVKQNNLVYTQETVLIN